MLRVLSLIALCVAGVTAQAAAPVESHVMSDFDLTLDVKDHLPGFIREMEDLLAQGDAENYFAFEDHKLLAIREERQKLREQWDWSGVFTPWHKDTTKEDEGSVDMTANGVTLYTAPGVTLTRSGDYGIVGCYTHSILGEACVKLVADIENLKYQVSLTVKDDLVFHKSGTITLEACIDEDKLYALLSSIPVLLPYKPIIDKARNFLKRIPASIFSVCLGLRGASFKDWTFKACPDVDYNILCFKGKCLSKGLKTLGCFELGGTHS